MTFFEAIMIHEGQKSRPKLIEYLRSNDIPNDLRSKARSVATKIEAAESRVSELITGLKGVPDFSEYVPEHRQGLTTRARAKALKDADIRSDVAALEREVKGLLSALQESSRTALDSDPRTAEMMLLAAREDARMALQNTRQGNIADAIERLQAEALANGERGLAHLLGATPWAERFVRTNGSHDDVDAFERIRGGLLEAVSDPEAKPYRETLGRLGGLADVPGALSTEWRYSSEELGVLTEEVAAALGL